MGVCVFIHNHTFDGLKLFCRISFIPMKKSKASARCILYTYSTLTLCASQRSNTTALHGHIHRHPSSSTRNWPESICEPIKHNVCSYKVKKLLISHHSANSHSFPSTKNNSSSKNVKNWIWSSRVGFLLVHFNIGDLFFNSKDHAQFLHIFAFFGHQFGDTKFRKVNQNCLLILWITFSSFRSRYKQHKTWHNEWS